MTDKLWGWQVTLPEAVEGAKWQALFETYVQDRHALGIREKFRAAENLAAYKVIVDRMLTVIEKGYWDAAPEIISRLHQAQADLAPAVAAEHEAIAQRAQAQLEPAPGPAVPPLASRSPTLLTAANAPVVRGRVIEEKRSNDSLQKTAKRPAPHLPRRIALLSCTVLWIAAGWWLQGRVSGTLLTASLAQETAHRTGANRNEP
jgi:cobaltochelatase CobN